MFQHYSFLLGVLPVFPSLSPFCVLSVMCSLLRTSLWTFLFWEKLTLRCLYSTQWALVGQPKQFLCAFIDNSTSVAKAVLDLTQKFTLQFTLQPITTAFSAVGKSQHTTDSQNSEPELFHGDNAEASCSNAGKFSNRRHILFQGFLSNQPVMRQGTGNALRHVGGKFEGYFWSPGLFWKCLNTWSNTSGGVWPWGTLLRAPFYSEYRSDYLVPPYEPWQT